MEKYAEYLLPDGMVSRLFVYDDMNRQFQKLSTFIIATKKYWKYILALVLLLYA